MPTKQKGAPLSLLHLPDELLLQVVEELDGNDLFTLSVQCKRLQRLSLPPYLLCRGVTTPLIFPIDRLVLTKEQFAAPGMPLAFFTKSVRSFSCDIGPIRMSRACTTLALHRLCEMIINMKGLQDLAIYFKDWRFSPLVQWDFASEACKYLLEVVAERCTSLTLHHNGNAHQIWMLFHEELIEEEATKWRSPSLKGPPKGPFKGVRKRLSLGISRSRSSHSTKASRRPSSALKTLSFESNMFLLPPFSGWAFKILNTAPLTRLDLVAVDLSYAPRISALVFGALSIPTLEHSRIITCQIEFDALAEFLSRHKTISTFDIISGDMRQLPVTTLPALVSLKCNLKDVNQLLTPSGAFPKLAHVCVAIHLPINDDQFELDAVENSRGPAGKRLAMTNIRLCLDIHPASRSSNFLRLETLPNDLRNFPVLGRVREIVVGFPDPDVVAMTTIQTWLSLFPLLEHIEFLSPPTGLDHEAKMSLLRPIAQHGARIRTVKIGDDTRDISVWLSSDN